MNVKGKMNRMFGACILLLMAVMAACTITFTATAEDGGGGSSYSLVVQKKFDFTSVDADDSLTDAAKAEIKKRAQEQTYTFKITGTRKGKDGETIDVDRTVKLSQANADSEGIWVSETYRSEGPFDVTVTELTDNILISDGKNHYNMAGSSSDTRVMVSSRKHELPLRNNSTLIIHRANENGSSGSPEVLWYRLTSRPYEGHLSGNYKPVDVAFPLGKTADGNGEEKMFTRLSAAIYTIEQIAAPEGYQLQMGEREETVGDDGEGHFHINGTPGKLTLTSGGTAGDGVVHCYTVDRTETEAGDDSVYEKRVVYLTSGEEYVFPNLPRGGYTVTENSFLEDANTEFSVLMPQTTQNERSPLSSAPQYTNFRTFSLTEGTTYFKLNSFGPLYDASKKKINTSITYNFAYGYGNEKGGISYSTVGGGPFNTNKGTYTLNNAAARYPVTPMIGFRTENVSSSTAKYISVSWTEYFEKDVLRTFGKAGQRYSNLSVDDRGWMKITAPAVEDGSDASQIVYYYKVEDSKNQLITGKGGTTDKPDTTTVMLKAGESVKLSGLTAGSYKVTEDVEWKQMGFTMKVEGDPFGVTEAGKPIQVQVGGKRSVIISKPAPGIHPDGTEDTREYTFNVSGTDSFNKTVSVKAGESIEVELPKAGSYTVRPENDVLGTFDLDYADSGAIYGTASGSTGTITFTNVFDKGEFGYRYVHEYYVKDADGTYSYEGNSQITTRLGRNEDESYEAGDLSQAPEFNSNHYEHFDEAYGWVDPITSTVVDQDEEVLTDAVGEKKGEAGSEELTSSDEEPPDSGEAGDTKTPDEDTPDSDEGEDAKAPDGEPPDSGEGGESQAPDEENPDSGEEGDTRAPDKENPDSSEGGDTKVLDGENPDFSGNEEAGSANGDTMNISETGEPEAFREDAAGLIRSAAPEGLKTSGEGTPDFIEGTDTENGKGENPGSGGEGDTQAPDEGTPAPGEENPDSSEGGDTETPDEENPGSGEGGDTEIPDGGNLDSDEGGDTKAPDGDTPDSDEGGEIETPDADNSASGEKKEPADEDSLKTDEKEETELLDEDSLIKKEEKAPFRVQRMKIEEHQTATSYDENGIINRGSGLDSSSNVSLNYEPDSSKDFIVVTEDASQIIIMRYYRDRQPAGKYNVIHVYYRRDEKGDHWEGTSGVLLQDGELGVKYNGNGVDKIYNFQPDGEDQAYNYVWDGRPQYGVVEKTNNNDSYDPTKNEYAGNGMVYRPNNDWTTIEGTEEGNQIIILRYYREPGREGYYNIVHEYYVREESSGNQDETAHSQEPNLEPGSNEPSQDDDSETGEEDDISDAFAGTLNVDDGFAYTFEGNTELKFITAPLGITHTAREEDWELEYGGNEYTYINAGYGTTSDHAGYNSNPNQQWASATEEGNEVVILRYYREADEPEPTPTPTPVISGEHDGQEETTENSETTSEDSSEDSFSEDSDARPKSHPTALPTSSPGSTENITAPESGSPRTGDDSQIFLWIALAAGSLCGMGILGFVYRKRKKNKES